MTTLIESLSAAVLLILAVLLVTHMLNGTASTWISSKVKVA
jgi:hypothetical protein